MISGFEYVLDIGSAILELFYILFVIIGMLLIIYGGLIAAMEIIIHEWRKKKYTYYHIRHQLTDKILFGLEFLIAADVIKSVLHPGLEEILTLGAIVLIRTIMGHFLSKEISEYSFEE